MKKEVDDEDKPKLKDLEDFNPNTSTGRVLNFAEKKKEIDDEDKSKFDIDHEPYFLYFKMRSCGPGVHCYYVQKSTVEHPEFGTIEGFIPVDDKHIQLNSLKSSLIV